MKNKNYGYKETLSIIKNQLKKTWSKMTGDSAHEIKDRMSFMNVSTKQQQGMEEENPNVKIGEILKRFEGKHDTLMGGVHNNMNSELQ